MARFYYLFPPHEGPFPNPFSIDDPLFEVSQSAVRHLRKKEEDEEHSGVAADAGNHSSPAGTGFTQSDSYKKWRLDIYHTLLECCRISFVALANRTLVSEPPSEAHLDFAMTEAARRALALVFYVYNEATGFRVSYSDKRGLEVLLTDWAKTAKEIWRARVLDSNCDELMGLWDEPQWHVPTLSTFLGEELFHVGPDIDDKPPGIQERLFVPATFGSVDLDEIGAWINQAFRNAPRRDSPESLEEGSPVEDLRSISDGESRQRPRLSKRAKWLSQQLLERGWSASDPYAHGGPDRKTIEKILRGESVRNDVLKKLADSLSASREGPIVRVLDIPEE